MIYLWWLAGLVLVLMWLSRDLDAWRGMPTIVDISCPGWDAAALTLPRVSIIVPARNEAQHIEQALRSLLRLDYPDYEIIAVNDRSTDGTGRIMGRIAAEVPGAPLEIIHIDELPPAWLGKTHAMWKAAQRATGEWLLFTDADVVFRPDALRRAMNYALRAGADHLVLFPRMLMQGVGEHMMTAFFQILFVWGHRPWKTADPQAEDYMGVGAFNLVRHEVYEAVGTYQALRLSVVDDMRLGEAIKRRGFAQRNVFGADLLSIRWTHGAMGMVNNLTKNFFAIMRFRSFRAISACLLGLFLNLFPFVAVWLAPGWARLEYGIALLAIFLMYVGMSWHAPISPLYFFLHPIATVLFAYTMLRSMALTLWHSGVEWRGTRYPLDELRKGMV